MRYNNNFEAARIRDSIDLITIGSYPEISGSYPEISIKQIKTWLKIFADIIKLFEAPVNANNIKVENVVCRVNLKYYFPRVLASFWLKSEVLLLRTTQTVLKVLEPRDIKKDCPNKHSSWQDYIEILLETGVYLYLYLYKRLLQRNRQQ